MLSLNVTVRPSPNPRYIRMIRNVMVTSTEKGYFLEEKYAELLEDETFTRYVINNDATVGHTPMVNQTQTVPLLSEHEIKYLYEQLDKDIGMDCLKEKFEKDRFVVISDDWMNYWVYVGESSDAFHEWYDEKM